MAKEKPEHALRPRPTRVKAVVFDLDGTLIHSAVDFARLKRETIDFLTRNGLPAESFSTEMKSYDIMLLASELFRKKGLTEKELTFMSKRIEAIWNWIELESVSKATPVKGAKKTLLELRKRGLKVGIVTRGCREYATEALEITGLPDLVDIIVGRDDVAQSKPCPDPLIKAMETLGLKAEEVVMVGDNVDDAQCAQGAKVRFIGVKSGTSTTKTFKDLKYEVLLEDLGDLTTLLH